MSRKDREGRVGRIDGPSLLARFRTAVAALPQMDREVFLLHARDGLDCAQIGQRLGMRPSETERHLSRALVQLAAALDETR